MTNETPLTVAVLLAELIPAILFGFAAEKVSGAIGKLPAPARVILPVLLVLPYLAVALAAGVFRWEWFAIYAGLPIVMTWLLMRAADADPGQHGNWRDALILLALGLAVDLRWFDSAWPRGSEGLGKLLLVDAGLYGFLAIRRLEGTGFNFCLRWSDWKTGLSELSLFAPVVLVLGFALGFIHPHAVVPSIGSAVLRWQESLSLSRYQKSCFFEPGPRTCSSAAWGIGPHCYWRRFCLGFRTSTNATCQGMSLTGAMFCWRPSLEFSTAAPGARAAAFRPRLSRTRLWIGSGPGGSSGSVSERVRWGIGNSGWPGRRDSAGNPGQRACDDASRPEHIPRNRVRECPEPTRQRTSFDNGGRASRRAHPKPALREPGRDSEGALRQKAHRPRRSRDRWRKSG